MDDKMRFHPSIKRAITRFANASQRLGFKYMEHPDTWECIERDYSVSRAALEQAILRFPGPRRFSEDEVELLVIALHDAIQCPPGVVPDSAKPFIQTRFLEIAKMKLAARRLKNGRES